MATGYDIDRYCFRLGQIIKEIIGYLNENNNLSGFISGHRANLDDYLNFEMSINDTLIYLKAEYEGIRNEMEMLLKLFEEDHDDNDETEEFYKKLKECLDDYSPIIIQQIKNEIRNIRILETKKRQNRR
jgi:hypothetical protein